MTDKARVRDAAPQDAGRLGRIARESEACWGYDQGFMEKFQHTFNITPDFIAGNPVKVVMVESEPAAFWGMQESHGEWELEYFYVSRNLMGSGYGAWMWGRLTAWCREQNIQEFSFVTSPQAVGFYEKMGAVQNGMSLSLVDGRPIPHFVYRTGVPSGQEP